MDSKIVEKVKNKLKLKFSNKGNILLLVGFIGIFLILMSELPLNKSDSLDKKDNDKLNTNYVEEIEKKTSQIVSSINGVGRCKVMITVMQTNESVYAKNVDENNQHGYYSQNNEYVLYKDENGETPMLIKENYPKITGVAIVCDGADKIEVKKQIIDVVTSLFDISSSHISVSKIKQ